jgi:hypothetical protein
MTLSPHHHGPYSTREVVAIAEREPIPQSMDQNRAHLTYRGTSGLARPGGVR